MKITVTIIQIMGSLSSSVDVMYLIFAFGVCHLQKSRRRKAGSTKVVFPSSANKKQTTKKGCEAIDLPDDSDSDCSSTKVVVF